MPEPVIAFLIFLAIVAIILIVVVAGTPYDKDEL